MSGSKTEKFFVDEYNFDSYHPMNANKDTANAIERYLPTQALANLSQTSRNHFFFYSPHLERRELAEKAQYHIVRADLIPLIPLIQPNPRVLFEKCEKITGLRGQTYYNASPYQLINFLCDDDMKKQCMALIPEGFSALRDSQYAEVDCGGADLIKIDRDPYEIKNELGFKGLTHYKKIYTLFDKTQEITFRLLENTDGIICYQNQLFYVNQEKEILEFLDDSLSPEAFEQFKTSFADMEDNSGRRSSEEEHKLIEKLFDRSLVRKGILYEQNGIFYRDSYTPFNIVPVYRKYIRLCEEAAQIGNWQEVALFWDEDVRLAQEQEIWILRRICERNKPFYPFKPENFVNFERECVLVNWHKYTEEPVFVDGLLTERNFAFYKGEWSMGRPNDIRFPCVNHLGAAADLVAISWLIENAKTNGMEWTPEPAKQVNCTFR